MTEAFSAAAQRRSGRLEQGARRRRLAVHSGQSARRSGASDAQAATDPARAVLHGAGADTPRPLNAMLDDLLSALDHVDELAAQSALQVQGTGTSGYHKLTIRLSAAGPVSCVVDEPWALHQSAATLVAAFDEALARAKADLTVQRRDRARWRREMVPALAVTRALRDAARS